ncbi:hypothetical protein DR64_722 [Paraburkholderia xenovorans LB400]|uniref:hypothetical protein n=1 Tax=Paraburkholderia xenovorans TaxID=36873 RepID=UPI0004F91DE9|nr:hypothetical protein [Paraburkholderia xenovorans]AIP31734.1 hypothetical protein DR64_722 [Paraburkholderia xenovorans LB400]
MTTINVQFADSTQTAIVSFFSGAPDPEFWSNCGTVDTSDPRWAAYYAEQQKFFPPIRGLPEPTIDVT